MTPCHLLFPPLFSEEWRLSEKMESHRVKLEMPLETKKRSRSSKSATTRVVPDNSTKSKRCKRNKLVVDELQHDHIEVQPVAVKERAEEIRASLSPEFPSFTKLMLRSHVTKGFWLGLSSKFCKLHLPRHDETVVLEGESGEEYKTNYLAYKVGLSGGWRGFSIAHKLLEGDVLVFHLVHHCKFKVYVVRANDLAEIDGAPGLLNLDPCAEEIDFDVHLDKIVCKEKVIKRCKKVDEKHLRPLSPDILEELTRKSSSQKTDDFENFSIIVNGSSIDSHLSNHLRAKYYELCCTQRSHLHHDLHNKINTILAAGVIAETLSIADAIKSCKVSTSRDDFAIWVNTLKAFKLLGMDVGFLLARLDQLVSLVDSPEAAKWKRYMEAQLERERAEEEIRTLESRILELKLAKIKLDDEIEGLKVSSERCEVMFMEEANSSW